MEDPFEKWKTLLKMDNLILFRLNVHKEQQRRSMDLRGEARGQK